MKSILYLFLFVLCTNIVTAQKELSIGFDFGVAGQATPSDGFFFASEVNWKVNRFIDIAPAFSFSSIKPETNFYLSQNPNFITPFADYFEEIGYASLQAEESLTSITAGGLGVYFYLKPIDWFSVREDPKFNLLVGSGVSLKMYSSIISRIERINEIYTLDYIVVNTGEFVRIDYLKILALFDASERMQLGFNVGTFNVVELQSHFGLSARWKLH